MKAMTVNLKGIGYSFEELKNEAVKNWRMLLLVLLFICGMLTGAALYKNFGENISKSIADNFSEILKYSFLRVFLIIFIAAIIPLLISFFNSFNALGMPVILFIPAFYGLVISFLSSFLYTNYRKDGVIFALVLIFPAAVINTLMLIAVNNESLILSGIVSRNVFSSHKEGRGETKAFFLRYITAALITAVTCAADALAITAIGKNLLF